MAPPNPNAQRYSPTMMWDSIVRTFPYPPIPFWEEPGGKSKTPRQGKGSAGQEGSHVACQGEVLFSDYGMKEGGWVLTCGCFSLADSTVGVMGILFRQILLPAAVSIRGYAGNHSELRAGSRGCPWNGRGGSCVPFGVRISSLPPHWAVSHRGCGEEGPQGRRKQCRFWERINRTP